MSELYLSAVWSYLKTPCVSECALNPPPTPPFPSFPSPPPNSSAVLRQQVFAAKPKSSRRGTRANMVEAFKDAVCCVRGCQGWQGGADATWIGFFYPARGNWIHFSLPKPGAKQNERWSMDFITEHCWMLYSDWQESGAIVFLEPGISACWLISGFCIFIHISKSFLCGLWEVVK